VNIQSILHRRRIEQYLREGRTVGGGCGASKDQTQILQEQKQNFDQMSSEAATVFGNASDVFKSLQSSFAPIVAAGPGQQGYTPAEEAALKSSAITQTGNAYRNAAQAAGERGAAAGGGTTILPSGAQMGQQAAIAEAGAAQTAGELNQIDVQSAELGRQNWLNAAGILGGATGTFGASTGAGSAATGAGSAAASEANTVQQANNQWAQDLIAVGSSAASTVGSIMCPAEGSLYLMADGSEKPVETLVLGELIAGIDDEPQMIEEIQSQYTNIIKVSTENGLVTRNSPVHAFALPKGGFVVSIRALGKTILTKEGPSKVTKIEPDGMEWVFNVITNGSHTYRADGVWSLGVGDAERHIGMNEWAELGNRMMKDKTKWATAGVN